MSILCIGEMLIDFTPVAGMDNTYTANPGGAPANVAVSVARNDIKAGFLGKLGNDDFGRMLKKTLEDNNVEVLCPELTDAATTTLAFVTLDKTGDRSFTFARKPGADLLLDDEDVSKVDFMEWDIVHAGSVSQSGLPEREAVISALRKAKECGKLVSFDINYRDKIWSFDECKKQVDTILPYVDMLKISEEELDFVCDGKDISAPDDEEKCSETEMQDRVSMDLAGYKLASIAEKMNKYGIKVLICTMGAKGVKIFNINNSGLSENSEKNSDMPGAMPKCSEIQLDAMKVQVKDTTGAGDAFWGAFLSSLVRQGVKKTSDINDNILREAGMCGVASSAICITQMGGIPAIPAIAAIKETLKAFSR